MNINFTKMHGLGNDFIIIDGVHQTIQLNKKIVQQYADRHLGIGFDQCLLIEKPSQENADFDVRIFNADGSEAEQCGNGIRCVARFIVDKKLSHKKDLQLAIAKNIISTKIETDDTVRVNMGQPQLQPQQIPMVAAQQALSYPIRIENNTINVHAIGMGNPHAVILVDDIQQAPVKTLGATLTQHACFPQGANIGFMQILNPQHIQLRVVERGVGETLACGSGACAAMVAGRLAHDLEEHVTVSLPGGDLKIAWAGHGADVYMTGPAVFVFEGSIEI
ncbi:MAG: diaminopimelate epimerase [Gammaproteobacteria bacterium]